MKIRKFGVILVTSTLLITIISLFSQPIYANSCQATITSTPSNADVYVDGRLIGQSPTTYLVGSPFEADIRVEKEGYETWTQHISVALNEHKQVNAILTPLQQVPQQQKNITSTTTSTNSTTTSTSSSTSTTSTTSSTSSSTSMSSSTTSSSVTEETASDSTLIYVATGLALVIIVAALLYTKKIKV